MYLVKVEENINKINNSQPGHKNVISAINKIDVMQNKSKYTITKVCKVRWRMLKETLQLRNILFLFIYAFLKHYIVRLTFNKKHYFIYMNHKNDKVLEKCDQFIKTYFVDTQLFLSGNAMLSYKIFRLIKITFFYQV